MTLRNAESVARITAILAVALLLWDLIFVMLGLVVAVQMVSLLICALAAINVAASSYHAIRRRTATASQVLGR